MDPQHQGMADNGVGHILLNRGKVESKSPDRGAGDTITGCNVYFKQSCDHWGIFGHRTTLKGKTMPMRRFYVYLFFYKGFYD